MFDSNHPSPASILLKNKIINTQDKIIKVQVSFLVQIRLKGHSRINKTV